MFVACVCGCYLWLLHSLHSSSDNAVKVWDAGTRQCVHTFYEHTDQVNFQLLPWTVSAAIGRSVTKPTGWMYCSYKVYKAALTTRLDLITGKLRLGKVSVNLQTINFESLFWWFKDIWFRTFRLVQKGHVREKYIFIRNSVAEFNYEVYLKCLNFGIITRFTCQSGN